MAKIESPRTDVRSRTGTIGRAEALGAALPPLLIAAERIAATVAQGVHGRRRVGQGESFWQFRPFVAGDTVARIDWRQSAKSDRAFVRETEWEAAQSVFLWRDGGPAMAWRSRRAAVSKLERADLLALALAALLLRGGERVGLIAPGMRPATGRAGLERLAADLAAHRSAEPPDVRLPRHANLILFGDFLGPLPEIQATVGRLAATPARGHIVQILDPAEADLPYAGRVRFQGLAQGLTALIPRVEDVRAAYVDRLAAQRDGLAAIAGAAGWGFTTHRTDHPPQPALLALYAALAT